MSIQFGIILLFDRQILLKIPIDYNKINVNT